METVTSVIAFAVEHPVISLIIFFMILGIFTPEEEGKKDFLEDYIDGYVTGIPTGGAGSWLGASAHWDEEK